MKKPGSDSPDSFVPLCEITGADGNGEPVVRFRVGVQTSTVNESMKHVMKGERKTTVGWDRSYAENYDRIFGNQN
jgi:hypothetical protein